MRTILRRTAGLAVAGTVVCVGGVAIAAGVNAGQHHSSLRATAESISDEINAHDWDGLATHLNPKCSTETFMTNVSAIAPDLNGAVVVIDKVTTKGSHGTVTSTATGGALYGKGWTQTTAWTRATDGRWYADGDC